MLLLYLDRASQCGRRYTCRRQCVYLKLVDKGEELRSSNDGSDFCAFYIAIVLLALAS